MTREFITFRTDDTVERMRIAKAEEHRQNGAFYEAKGQQQSIIWTVSASKKKYKITHGIATFVRACVYVLYPRRKRNCYVCNRVYTTYSTVQVPGKLSKPYRTFRQTNTCTVVLSVGSRSAWRQPTGLLVSKYLAWSHGCTVPAGILRYCPTI